MAKEESWRQFWSVIGAFQFHKLKPTLECDFLSGMDQGSGCIESHGPANQTKHQSEFLSSSTETVVSLVGSLGAGEIRKNYRASRSGQQALRRLERRYLHAFA